jgi:hypothetical protein
MNDQNRRSFRLLDSALSAAERGWFVHPLQPRQKLPTRSPNWERRATRDHATLRRWFLAAPFNIGIATGPSSLLVIDLDPMPAGAPRGHHGEHGRDALRRLTRERGEALPETFVVATPRDGRHLYFVAPEDVPLGNTAGRLAPGIDTRGVGGYVVGPGSVVANRYYRIVCASPPAPLPRWLVETLRPSPARPSALPPDVVAVSHSTDRARNYADAALRGEVQNVVGAAVGSRNQTLFIAAARLGGFVASGLLTEQVVRAALTTASAPHLGVEAFTDDEVRRTVESGLQRGARLPRRVPAGPTKLSTTR